MLNPHQGTIEGAGRREAAGKGIMKSSESQHRKLRLYPEDNRKPLKSSNQEHDGAGFAF